MPPVIRNLSLATLCLIAAVSSAGCAHDGALWSLFAEQKTIDFRDPAELPKARIPDIPPPPTVSDSLDETGDRYLSLDEAIHIALANAKVVRVLAGVTAVSSGQTIYDPAISNTVIDQEKGRFDPILELNNSFDRFENPLGVFDPLHPFGARIDGNRNDVYNASARLSKTTYTGGIASLNFNDSLRRITPGVFALNPENRHDVTLRFDQPLLKGGGIRANLAPIVVARINTERSYFQFKDSVQEMVRGVIEAYWALVFARTDVWARGQQAEQGKAAYDRAVGRRKAQFASRSEVAQAKSALANFEANLIIARANAIQREAALRNIIGLPPSGLDRLVPVTPPTEERLQVNWPELMSLAEQRRPDLIELKLIIEADQQLLEQFQNQAWPSVDAVALYRWNGLEGRTPSRARISTEGGQFTDWTLGVNFSVPLGLRTDRAALRQQQLIIARDRVNLNQGMHSAVHELATSTRNLAQFYEQYKAFSEARKAGRENLEEQKGVHVEGGIKGRRIDTFINLRQAIADWGNAVSAQAQTLAQYNTELATLERLTGTILETHGIYFFEERFQAIGPLGRHCKWPLYPSALNPGPNAERYQAMEKPAENFFNLEDPLKKTTEEYQRPRTRPELLPLPKPATSRELPQAQRREAPQSQSAVLLGDDVGGQSPNNEIRSKSGIKDTR